MDQPSNENLHNGAPKSHLTADIDKNSNHLTSFELFVGKISGLFFFKNSFLSIITFFLFCFLKYMIHQYSLNFLITFIYVCAIQLFILFNIELVNRKRKKSNKSPDYFNDEDIHESTEKFFEKIKKFKDDFFSFRIFSLGTYKVPTQLFVTSLLWINFVIFSIDNIIITFTTTVVIFLLPSVLNSEKIHELFISSDEYTFFVPFFFLVVFLCIFITSKIFEFHLALITFAKNHSNKEIFKIL